MITTTFDTPITVLVGMGFQRRLSNLIEGIGFLDDLPSSARDEAYDAALLTFRSASRGEIDLQTARDVFTGYARRHGVLVEESHEATLPNA